jgi:hypothetical protein
MRLVTAIAIAIGAWIGSPSAAPALVRIDVDLGAQKMIVASDSGESFQWPISSGAAGSETPRGTFRPTALYPMVYSYKYGNEPMPHSIFFHGQYAIHGTVEVDALGRPASHGCIRLAPSDAAVLFALVSREGAMIRISGEPAPADLAAPSGGGLWEGWAAEPFSAGLPKAIRLSAHGPRADGRRAAARVEWRWRPIAFHAVSAARPLIPDGAKGAPPRLTCARPGAASAHAHAQTMGGRPVEQSLKPRRKTS